jgi:protein-disulfide isomerase-like protein with CxxC motif
MSSTIQIALNECALKILRPLVRVLIRNGVSCGSFEELVRKAYVDEAYTIGRRNKQKTTVSSVSAQTGLSRKEVKRLKELEENRSDVEQKYNRAIRVISGWLNDEGFTDATGQTRDLPLDNSEHSFAALVKQFSGDIPTKAMLNLLLAAKCVKVDDNKVKLIKHAYVPGNDSAEVIGILGIDTNELINTIDFNLTSGENEKRYQRKVSTTTLNEDYIEDFKTLANKRSQALLEELDAWLTQNEVSSDDENACYVSLGIYYYEHEVQEDKYED